MNWIQMRDFWTFRPTEVQENKRHLFECKDSKSDTGHSLLVHVAATHSGIVNGNRRFYRPDRMQDSIHTWLPQKTEDGKVLRTARPVLVGHDEKGDVLGRVLEASYIDESWRYASDFPIVKDFLFYNRDGRRRQTLHDSVDWIVDNLLPLKDYTGLGYTDLGLRITNPEAIRKVLADEYLTVSVGFKTDSAVCSLCHTDWATDGKCGHKLGEVEDGKSMFLIAGAMVNEEISFINFAADPFATTLSKKVLTDSLEKMFFLGLPINEQNTATADGLQLTDGLIFETDMAATEEPTQSVMDMSTIDLAALGTELKAPELTRERAKEIKDSLSAWTPETEEQKSKKRSLVSTVNAKIRHNSWDKIEETMTDSDDRVAEELRDLMEDGKKKSKPGPSGQSKGASKKEEKGAKETQQKEIASKEKHADGCDCEECMKAKDGASAESIEDADQDLCWDNWQAETDEDRDYFADTDGIYTELEVELDAAVTDGELDANLLTDAKLSTEKRKELPKGSFCGPNRSFPVADCAHVTAARRLIGRAKVSDATKSKILACVDRKAKSLSCTTSAKKKDGNEEVVIQKDEQIVERYTKLVDSVLMQDAEKPKEVSPEQRAKLVSIIKALDEGYDSLGDAGENLKWILRMAVRSMLDDWNADDSLAWSLKLLGGNKDHVVLTRSELDEKDETLNGLMTEKDSLVEQVKALTDSRTAVLGATKHSLAQQIVMHNVLKGQDGYKDLTSDQIQEKVNALSKRHITSLRDSVSDILSGLKWTDSSNAAPASPETTGAVDDHTQITEKAPAGVAMTDGAQSEVDEAQELLEQRLRFMPPRERTRLLSQMRFEAAQQIK